ncbi:hypothetical protein DBR06_SOUSAS12210031, partial [Sousa chinensis]
FYPSLRHDVTNVPFNNLIDSSFEPERASVGKHGNIFPIYGSFQSKPQPHFCCEHPSFESTEITIMIFWKKGIVEI